jgi:hypothetical protein
MPNSFWTDSTFAPFEPSNGALPMPYTRPSSLLNWPPELSRAFEWAIEDESTGGNVQFLAKVEITGEDVTAITSAALHRMICFFVLSRLSENSLAEACQSLSDIYLWQINQTNAVVSPLERHRHGPAKSKRVDRTPFVFREG